MGARTTPFRVGAEVIEAMRAEPSAVVPSDSHYAFVIVRFGDGYRRAAPFRTVPSGCSHPRVGIGWTLRRIEPSSSAARRFTCVGGLKREQC